MGMACSAVRSRSPSLRHKKITEVNLPDWKVDLTVVYISDRVKKLHVPV